MVNTYIIVVMGILCAKAAGFLRDAVLASSFGTGIEADIYLQIFGIASLVFTAVGSALSTLVIKNINKPKYAQGDAQNRYAAYFMRYISLIIILITGVLYIFAKPITKLLLSDLTELESECALRIMYIMLPSFLFICIAYMMSGLLQNRRVFFTPSVMSLPYNVLVIAVMLLGIKDIEIISIATTIGWFLHIVIQLPDFYRKGYGFFRKKGGIDTGGEKSAVLETLYIFISGLMLQLCFMTDRAFVSASEGMISTLNYGSNLFITFSGLFVVAMSSVVFPAISQNYEHGEMDYVRELIRYMIKLMVSIFAFYLIAVVFFGEFAISMIYERGAFTHEDTVNVALSFVIYSFAIFGYLGQNILNKLFYIAGKYKVTVIGAVVVVVLNAVVDKLFVPVFGMYFAAISSTVLLTLYTVFVAVKLKSVIGKYINSELLKTLAKIAISSAVTVLFLALWKMAAPSWLNEGFYNFIPFAISLLLYAVILAVSGVIKDLFATPLSKIK